MSDKDGAGGINAILADEIAKNAATSDTCLGPCWWEVHTTANNPAPGYYFDKQFPAVQGERLRVAMTWFSYVESPPTFPVIPPDTLRSDFDLEVIGPGNSSFSYANPRDNFEIIEFVAPSTGMYTVRVHKSLTTTEATNTVGIAWSRQATFLPDIRRNSYGWTSTITIRNDGTFGRVVRTTFIRQDNSAAWPVEIWLTPGGSYNVPFPAGMDSSFWGNAVIDGNEDISAVVVQERASPNTRDAYAGVSYSDTEFLVPLVHRNNSGWYSQLILQNAGGTPAIVGMHFYPLSGRGQECSNQNFAVGGGFVLYTDSLSCLGNSFVGSVHITSTNGVPVAVVSTQYKGMLGAETSLMSTTNSRASAATLQAPLVQNNNSGWTSSINLQNGSSNWHWFNFTYYGTASSSPCYGPSSPGVATSYGPVIVFPAPPAGNPCPAMVSAEIDNYEGAAAQINQIVSSSAQASTYSAIGYPSKLAIVPRLRKDDGWNDAIQIRNGNGSNVTVTLVYYAQNGGVIDTRPLTIAPHQSANYLSQGDADNQIPTGFSGSVVIMATQPVAATVNVWKSGAGGDELGSYPAIHR